MIINFAIENFRSINERVELSFEPVKYKTEKHLEDIYIYKSKSGIEVLKLAIIYGPNASGKTNILRALDFLKRFILKPPSSKTDVIDLKPFKFTQDKKNTVFEIEFLHDDIKYSYFIELNEKEVIKEEIYSFKPKKYLVLKRYKESNDIKIKYGSKIKLSKHAKEIILYRTLPNKSVISSFSEVNIKIPEIESIIKWFNSYLMPTIYPKTDLTNFALDKYGDSEVNKDIVLKALKRADFNISDIKIDKEEREIDVEEIKFILDFLKQIDSSLRDISSEKLRNKGKEIKIKRFEFEHIINGKRYYLEYEDESAGTQRFFQLAVVLALLIENNLIFPIDEIESSLHPDLIEFFLDLFLFNTKSIASQLILTTHYRELLMNDTIRRDIVWFTDKMENSSTELYSLTDFKSSEFRNTNSIYNFYKTGKLGAKPFLGSYRLKEIKIGKKK